MEGTHDLLRWSIANAVPSSGDASELHKVAGDVAAGKRADLTDPGLLEAILGKSDAKLMREAMEVAVDGTQSVEDRVIALDNLEMMIESLDNANDMETLNLWKPLLGLLSAPEDEIRQQAAWVCGTAIQNNPKSQQAFLALNPIPILLALISTSPAPSSSSPSPTVLPSSEGTRSRAVYALSGALKHNDAAVRALDEQDGWGWLVLKGGLSDPSLPLRRKTAFLLSTLLLPPTPPTTFTSLAKHGLPSALLDSLDPSPTSGHPNPGVDSELEPAHADADYREKAGRALVGLLEGDALTEDDKLRMAVLWTYWGVVGGEGGVEEVVGVTKEEARKVRQLLGIV